MSKPTPTDWCIRETQRLRALGLDGILVLPVPPSVNRIWRRGIQVWRWYWRWA